MRPIGSSRSVILVIGRRLALPWNFADDDLGTCTACGAFLRYRARGIAPGLLACPGCVGPGAEPDDVWILQGGMRP